MAKKSFRTSVTSAAQSLAHQALKLTPSPLASKMALEEAMAIIEKKEHENGKEKRRDGKSPSSDL